MNVDGFGSAAGLVLALLGLAWGLLLVLCVFAILRIPGYMQRQERRTEALRQLLEQLVPGGGRGVTFPVPPPLDPPPCPTCGRPLDAERRCPHCLARHQADVADPPAVPVPCPKCGAKLVLPATAGKGRCPKCHHVFAPRSAAPAPGRRGFFSRPR